MGLVLRRGQGGNELDANLLHGLGAVLAGADDVSSARPMLEQALALHCARGEPRGTARVLLSLGALLARQGEVAAGRAKLEESLRVFRELGEGVGVALCSLLLGVALPEGMLAELGENPLTMWWRLSLGRDAPLATNLVAWRIAEESPSVPASQGSSVANGLTPREIEIMKLLARRFTNREIADELNLSIRTVERHINNVFNKTGLTNRRQTLDYAQRHGLLPGD